MKIKKKWEGCKEKEFGGISGRIRKGKKRGGDEKEENGVERERERERERVFRFTEIGPSVFVGARGKVHLRDESYTWVSKSGSFIKLQEVGNFPTWIIFSLKTI